MHNAEFIWKGLELVRAKAPLVLSVTNYVVANLNANGLLAVGASPIMTHQPAEIDDLVTISGAVVVNMGTPVDSLPEAIYQATKSANRQAKPLIFDPVGAGASQYRNQVCSTLFESGLPDVIRGNASEIMALAGQSSVTKGVDSTHGSLEAQAAASLLARQYDCVVCVSGEVDLITDGDREFCVSNGNAMMPCITGLGCTATALVGAFVAVMDDAVEAVTAAMAVLGIAGDMALETAKGPATLQLGIIDTLYTMKSSDIEARAKVEE